MKKVKNHFRTKIINVIDPKRCNEFNNDIFFWKQRSSGERLNTVEFLREQIYLIQGHKSIPHFIKITPENPVLCLPAGRQGRG
jgi:hypothetical protein